MTPSEYGPTIIPQSVAAGERVASTLISTVQRGSSGGTQVEYTYKEKRCTDYTSSPNPRAKSQLRRSYVPFSHLVPDADTSVQHKQTRRLVHRMRRKDHPVCLA